MFEIDKSKFKKWLKEQSKHYVVFYKENSFIATHKVVINLELIDNLDDIKSSIVEVFKELHGEFVFVSGEKVDVDDYEREHTFILSDFIDNTINPEFFGEVINISAFFHGSVKSLRRMFDDLTLIPDELLMFSGNARYERMGGVVRIMEDDDVVCYIENTYTLNSKLVSYEMYDSLKKLEYDE